MQRLIWCQRSISPSSAATFARFCSVNVRARCISPSAVTVARFCSVNVRARRISPSAVTVARFCSEPKPPKDKATSLNAGSASTVVGKHQPLAEKLKDKLNSLATTSLSAGVLEQPLIAEVVHKSAALLGELQSNKHSEYKSIVGSVPMPLALINRLSKEQIDSFGTELFHFIIRTHYQPLYRQCTTERNGVIGTPGIAKSVSLLYPLLDHILQSNTGTNSSPVLLHSVAQGNAFLFFNGSCWKLSEFRTAPQLYSLRACLSKYPGLLYLVDGPTGNHSHIGDLLIGRTILVSSPGRENYYEFLKQGLRFMMPCWSLEELLEARKLVSPNTTEQMVRDRYERYDSIFDHLNLLGNNGNLEWVE